MHPLSMFPQLFYLELLAPLLLRLSVGVFLIILGKERSQKIYNWSSILYIISGFLLVLGLYTQIASIIAIIIIGFDFYVDNKINPFSKEKRILYMIVAVILLSLLFSGPGFFAFDLPL